MSQLLAMVRLDVLFQARGQVYTISFVVALLFGLMLRSFFPPVYAGRVLAVFFLLAVGGSTYFFGGALVLLEKSQGTLAALRTSPLLSRTYLASKTITLTGLVLLEGAIVYSVGFGGVPFAPLPLLLGLVVLGAFQTLVGLGQVASHDAVTSFLVPGGALIGTVLQLPVFYIFEAGPPWIWYLVPTQAPMLLVLGAFEPLESWQWAYALVVSALSLVAAAFWARKRFARHIGLPEVRRDRA